MTEARRRIQCWWQWATADKSWRSSVLISDCRKGFGIKVKSDFKSCSMKSMTMNTLPHRREGEVKVKKREKREDLLSKCISNHNLPNAHLHRLKTLWVDDNVVFKLWRQHVKDLISEWTLTNLLVSIF